MDNSYLVLKDIIEQAILDLNLDLGKEEFVLKERELIDYEFSQKQVVTTIYKNKKPLFQDHLVITERNKEVMYRSQSYLRLIKDLIKAGIVKTEFIHSDGYC